MDDGSVQKNGLHLNTFGFNHEDFLNLKLTIENIFGINSLNCSIHNHNKGKKNVYLGIKHGIDKIQHISVYAWRYALQNKIW